MSRYSSKLTLILFTIIFCEGYIVLASELLAIRQMNSYVGSGADTVSILIAAVLMPLAFGYYYGGQYKSSLSQSKKRISIRKQLVRNIFISFFFLAIALPNITVDLFFSGLFHLGLGDRFLLTSIYSLVFIVVPVFLLGQTVPLICNYFSKEQLSQITGKILFISTTGSFLGSVFTTIIMMQYFGVNNAVNFVLILLVALMFVLAKKKISINTTIATLFLLAIIFINSSFVLGQFGIVYSNAYNTSVVVEKDGNRHLVLNGSAASMIGKNGKKHPYAEHIEEHFLKTMANQDGQPAKILVIGAAGFTFGSEDHFNEYTFVDIDPDMKDVAEKYFLKQEIGKNKKFVGEDILAYLATNDEKYNLILLDAYSNKTSIPENLLTREFFLELKNSLQVNGSIVANFIVSPNFSSQFSVRVDNTFRSVYPHYNRQIIRTDYNPWSTNSMDVSNVVYSYFHQTEEIDNGIYTRNKNTATFDRPNVKYKN